MRTLTVATIVLLGVAALTGCGGDGAGSRPEDSVIPTPAAPAESTATPQPSKNSPDPGIVGTPVQMACTDVLTPDTLYTFNPNVGPDPAYSPTPLAQRALEINGIACGWLNQTSAVTYSVAIAQPDAAGLATLRDAAARAATAVELSDADGFVVITDTGGTAQAFIGGYWVVLESPSFISSSDVDELIAAISASLT